MSPGKSVRANHGNRFGVGQALAHPSRRGRGPLPPGRYRDVPRFLRRTAGGCPRQVRRAKQLRIVARSFDYRAGAHSEPLGRGIAGAWERPPRLSGRGAQPTRLPDALAKELGQEIGLLLVSVEPASAAEKGGLFLVDTLVSLGESPVRQMDDLFNALDSERIGKPLAVRIIRGGQFVELTVSPTMHP